MFRSISYEESRAEARRVSKLPAVEGSVYGVWAGSRSVTGRCDQAMASGMRAIAMVVLGVACTAAVAGPPFLTDDPEPVDLHHVEINAIAQQTRAATGRAGSVSGEVNVGCAAETQCHVAVPVAFNLSDVGPARAGLGDAELGVKYRFLNRPGDGWSAAVYPTLVLPTGDASRGLGNGRVQLLLPLWVQRSSGPWSWEPASPGSLIVHPERVTAGSAACSHGGRSATGSVLAPSYSTAHRPRLANRRPRDSTSARSSASRRTRTCSSRPAAG
jgi:hypothetical protein